MFGIGGWKQVGATFDMKRQAAIREQLEQAGIEYQVKVQNRLKSGVLSGKHGRGWKRGRKCGIGTGIPVLCAESRGGKGAPYDRKRRKIKQVFSGNERPE